MKVWFLHLSFRGARKAREMAFALRCGKFYAHHSPIKLVMAGLVPAIHDLAFFGKLALFWQGRRGCPA